MSAAPSVPALPLGGRTTAVGSHSPGPMPIEASIDMDSVARDARHLLLRAVEGSSLAAPKMSLFDADVVTSGRERDTDGGSGIYAGSGTGGGELRSVKSVRIDPVPVYAPQPIEFVNLPFGLGVLFDVASENQFVGRAPRPVVPQAPRPLFQYSVRKVQTPGEIAKQQEEQEALERRKKKAASHKSRAEGDDDEKKEGDDAEQKGDADSSAKKTDKKEASATAESPTADAAAASASPGRAAVDLPPGPPDNLLYLLYLASLPPGADDRCLRLYAHAREQQEKARREEEEFLRKLREEEDKECTHMPKISDFAKNAHGRKDQGFHESGLEWIKQRRRKLEAKRAKKDKEFQEEVMIPWSMDKTSVRIIQRSLSRRSASASARGEVDREALPVDATVPEMNKRQAIVSRRMTSNRDALGITSEVPRRSRSAILNEMTLDFTFTPVTNRYDFSDERTWTSVRRSASAAGGGVEAISHSEHRPADAASALRASAGITASSRKAAAARPDVSSISLLFQEDDDDQGPADASTSRRSHRSAPASATDAASPATAGDDAAAAGNDAAGAAAASDGHPSPAPGSGDANAKTVAERMALPVVDRLGIDLEERRIRMLDRESEYRRKQREKLYDRVTGQPLFEPNAVPTVLRNDGKRVTIDQLPRKERSELLSKWGSRKFSTEVVLGAWEKKVKGSKGDKEGGGDDGQGGSAISKAPRTMDEIVAKLFQKQSKSKSKVENIRNRERSQELQSLFKPSIEKRSAEMASSDPDRVPIYKQPLPKPAPKEKSNSPHRPAKSNTEAMNNMLQRAKSLRERREHELKNKVRQWTAEETKGMTFSPQLSEESKRLVAQRQGRLIQELEAFESHERQRRGASGNGNVYVYEDLYSSSRGGSAVPYGGAANAASIAPGATERLRSGSYTHDDVAAASPSRGGVAVRRGGGYTDPQPPGPFAGRARADRPRPDDVPLPTLDDLVDAAVADLEHDAWGGAAAARAVDPSGHTTVLPVARSAAPWAEQQPPQLPHETALPRWPEARYLIPPARSIATTAIGGLPSRELAADPVDSYVSKLLFDLASDGAVTTTAVGRQPSRGGLSHSEPPPVVISSRGASGNETGSGDQAELNRMRALLSSWRALSADIELVEQAL